MDLYSSRLLKEGDNIACWDTLNLSIQRIKRPFMFYPSAFALYRDYTISLLSHVNPYTGLAYKDDPALVFIDPINEATLLDQGFWDQWDDTTSSFYLPRTLKKELENQWDAWLSNKYQIDKNLMHVWLESNVSSGPDLIKNSDFSFSPGGLPSFWHLNVIDENAKANWGIEEVGPGGKPMAYIHVTRVAEYPWQIQMIQNHIPIIPHETYRLQFKAKANYNRSLVISIQRDRDPWTEYFRDSLTLSPSVTPVFRYLNFPVADTVQLVFSAGGDTGKFWLDEVRLYRSPNDHILDPGESLRSKTIKLIDWRDRNYYSSNRGIDQIRFMYDEETGFYKRLRTLLEDTLRVNSLVTSSCWATNSLPLHCWAENAEVMDEHSYFDHPSFPRKAWDILDFQITDQFFGGSYRGTWDQTERMFIGSNLSACPRKPRILSEWQHCSPNESRFVSLVPFSAYCALRDYDGMMNFDFSDGEANYALRHVHLFFESSGDPIRFILLRMGALAFLSDIEPEDRERVSWQFYPVDSLIRQVYQGDDWDKAVPSSPKGRQFNQFYWYSKKGTFIINTPGSKVFTGRTASDTAWLGGIRVIGYTDGAFVVSKISSSSSQSTFLVAALARTENTGMVWRDSTKQTGMVSW